MEEALYTLLTTTAAVTNLVPASRINLGEHPQGTGTPYVVLMVVGNEEGLTQQGPDGLFEGRVQIDCYAPTYGAAKLLSRAVRGTLHGHSGGGFGLVQHVATRDSREGGTNEAERLHRVSMDFLTAWRAA